MPLQRRTQELREAPHSAGKEPGIGPKKVTEFQDSKRIWEEATFWQCGHYPSLAPPLRPRVQRAPRERKIGPNLKTAVSINAFAQQSLGLKFSTEQPMEGSLLSHSTVDHCTLRTWLCLPRSAGEMPGPGRTGQKRWSPGSQCLPGEPQKDLREKMENCQNIHESCWKK